MVEIGAGGGSIARVDSWAASRSGRKRRCRSGPACYGRGGTKPAVTDANLSLGRFDRCFRGRQPALCPDRAGCAAAAVGEQLGLSAEMAALGVVEMVDENMANAARVHAIESGKGLSTGAP